MKTHGTNGAYAGGCHCQACRDAHTAYQIDYMRRHPEQEVKRRDRLHVKKGRMVRVTGPGGRLYRPGLYAAVPLEFRLLVRAEIEEANRRARECRGDDNQI